MKKKYEKPEIVMMEMSESMMISTSTYLDGNSQGDFREDFQRRRRDTWGSLWEEKKLENT